MPPVIWASWSVELSGASASCIIWQTYGDCSGGYVEAIDAYLQGAPLRVLTEGADLMGQVL